MQLRHDRQVDSISIREPPTSLHTSSLLLSIIYHQIIDQKTKIPCDAKASPRATPPNFTSIKHKHDCKQSIDRSGVPANPHDTDASESEVTQADVRNHAAIYSSSSSSFIDRSIDGKEVKTSQFTAETPASPFFRFIIIVIFN